MRTRLRQASAIWWAALSGGRFFTRWSLALALPLAVLVLAPYKAANSVPEVVLAQTAALLGALVLILALVPVAFAERRLVDPRVRGVVVLTAVVAASVGRPFLNEALAVDAFGLQADQTWPARIITNLVAWIALLSLVAITEQLYASSRDARERLLDALRTVTDEQRRAGRYERESRELVATEVETLRRALGALVLTPIDFDGVRTFSDGVRSASHRVQRHANLDLLDVAPDHPTGQGATRSRRRFLERLRPPPLLLVGAIFAAGSSPFAVHRGGGLLLALVLVGSLGAGLLADLASRRLGRRRDAAGRGAALLTVWAATGAIGTLVALPIIGAGFIALIPAIAFPGVAVIAALCADAMHRGRIEARRLGRALRDVARSAALRTSGTRRSLLRAADLLHGRVQGTCVIFAAQVDEEPATTEALGAFEDSVRSSLAHILLESEHLHEEPAGLAETVAVWQPVIAVSADVDASSQRALEDPLVSLRVVAVVAEGLVNAVKHAASRTAVVAVSARPSDAALHVTVTSPGQLRADAQLGGGLGVAGLGPSAQVYQRGRDVVLEAIVPVLEPAPVSAP
ncbi:sensor histidine kinase [Microbacterium radiodurans]|uniref:Uncharacterized protein n=1 Tax=Microbacterium radiodurans TaxID=661398 RepID=A0A5J5IQV1_9MICO|nr:hypothetical protein [Microbacterium radiodurans]KAA9084078.1 hypothetical protein F6B42_13910 [Microbacterium radiodurans]